MYPFTFPEIGDAEVRVKILYTSICQSDILTVRGNWGIKIIKIGQCNYPNCPGHEIIGEVTQLGKSANIRKVGQKVGVSPIRYSCLKCERCKDGRTNLC